MNFEEDDKRVEELRDACLSNSATGLTLGEKNEMNLLGNVALRWASNVILNKYVREDKENPEQSIKELKGKIFQYCLSQNGLMWIEAHKLNPGDGNMAITAITFCLNNNQ